MKRTPLKRSTNGEPRPCAWCGETFRGLSEHRNYRQKYCSYACRNAARLVERRKGWPDEPTMRRLVNDEKLSDAAIGRRYGHSYEWARQVRKAYGIAAVPKPPHRTIKHGRYVGADKFSVAVKGENRCRACGKAPQGTGPMGALHLHHAIPRSMCAATKVEILNGIPLCFDCHQGWHDRSVTIYRDVFTEQEWAFLSAVTLTGQMTTPWLDRHYPDRGLPFRGQREPLFVGSPVDGDAPYGEVEPIDSITFLPNPDNPAMRRGGGSPIVRQARRRV